MKTMMKTIDILRELAFFAELTEEELGLIEPLCSLIEGKAGNTIIQEGEYVQNLYIVLAGSASVLKKRADGKQVSIASVGKDDLLGEITFFKMTVASATVQASSAFKALVMNQSAFHDFLKTHSELGCKVYRKMARVLSERLRNRTGQLAEHLLSLQT